MNVCWMHSTKKVIWSFLTTWQWDMRLVWRRSGLVLALVSEWCIVQQFVDLNYQQRIGSWVHRH